MGETQEKQHHISFEEEASKGADYMANSSNITLSQSLTSWRAKYKRWLEIGFNSLLVLICLAAGTLLGELYYKEGGKSMWMNSLVQTGGFPVLFPFLFLKKRQETQDDNNARNNKNPSLWMFLSVYVLLGLLLGGSCMLNAVGLLHLPVSTFSLIAASQLGFNALFSFFLNSQRITTYIANSIILLTISSILLVFQPIDSSSGSNGQSSKGKSYTIGFICTLFGSAGMALLLSTTELIFRKIMKKRTVREVMNVAIWQSFFATCAILIGLFASGEWKWMKSEMQEYKLGKVSYVMTLVWTALCWQIYTIGLLSLIMKLKSSNASLNPPAIEHYNARQNTSGSARGRGRDNKRGGYQSNSGRGRASQNNTEPFTPTCYNCQGRGHTTRQCPSPKYTITTILTLNQHPTTLHLLLHPPNCGSLTLEQPITCLLNWRTLAFTLNIWH